MPLTIERPHPDALAMLAHVMTQFHGRLVDLQVRVGLLMARDPEDSHRTVLKEHGRPTPAITQVNTLVQRAQGMPDATIRLDAAAWGKMNAAQRMALLGRELHKLEIRRDKDEQPRADDQGRPMLALRPYDLYVCGFEAALRQHGTATVEAAQLAVVRETVAQQVLPFGGEPPLGKAGLDDAEAEGEEWAAKAQAAGFSPGTVEAVRASTTAAARRKAGPVVAKIAPDATISIDGGPEIPFGTPQADAAIHEAVAGMFGAPAGA